jgi:hypothetical protein
VVGIIISSTASASANLINKLRKVLLMEESDYLANHMSPHTPEHQQPRARMVDRNITV